MRVTTAGQTQAIIARLQASAQRFEKAQQRAVSGQRVGTLSDDPTAGTAIMRASGGLRGIVQYTRNVERVTAALDAEDSALDQVTGLLTRAKELGVASNSANASAQARSAAAIEVRQLFAQAVSVANTRVGDEYLFGGLNNDGRPPFDPDGAEFVVLDAGPPPAPRFPQGVRAVEVGAGGQLVEGAHDGTTVFLAAAPAARPTRPRASSRRSSGSRRRSSWATGRRSGPRSRSSTRRSTGSRRRWATWARGRTRPRWCARGCRRSRAR
jgi:flagellar hook-associated protein 3 FlgL